MGKVVKKIGGVAKKVAGPAMAIGGVMTGNPGLVSAGVGLMGSAASSKASKQAQQGAQAAAQAADPFSPYRAQYANQLTNLYSNPQSITTLPGYQFRLNQGLDSINRNAAAKGYLGSGNRLMELMRYGQDYGSQEFDNEINRLATLSGANIGSPAAAGGFLAQAGQIQGQGTLNTARSIGEMAGAVGDWWNSRKSPTTTTSSGYTPQPMGFNLPGGGIYYPQ